MSKLRLVLACHDYDRVRAIADGRVVPEGVEMDFVHSRPEATFPRMMRNREFDVAELSLAFYVMAMFSQPHDFVAIPVFPSRSFRHSAIYVSSASHVRSPADLAGKRVGAAGYHMTAMVWIRGILQDEYGVAADACEYWTPGDEFPPLALPARFKMRRIPKEKTLLQMLVDGEIDALHSPNVPGLLREQPGSMRRLFEDYPERELAYFHKTRIFPIMHVVVIKRELYERNRWLAASLYNAFVESKRVCYGEIYEAAALRNMLPWGIAEVESLRREMGDDWWPYGYANNRAELEVFLRYHHEQGLSPHRVRSDELFVPETLGL